MLETTNRTTNLLVPGRSCDKRVIRCHNPLSHTLSVGSGMHRNLSLFLLVLLSFGEFSSP